MRLSSGRILIMRAFFFFFGASNAHQMINGIVVAAVASVSAVNSIQAAIIIQQSVFTDDVYDSHSYNSGDLLSGTVEGMIPSIGGLSKFDPALGTLEKIAFSFFGELILLVDLSVYTFEAGDFTVDFEPEFDADGGVYYQPSNTVNVIHGPAVELVNFPLYVNDTAAEGGEFLYVDSFSTFDVFSYENLMMDAEYYAPDFIGTGNVSALLAGYFVPSSATVSFTGPVDSVNVSIIAEVISAEFVLECHYTPVPEPSTAILATGLAALGATACIRRRRSGLARA